MHFENSRDRGDHGEQRRSPAAIFCRREHHKYTRLTFVVFLAVALLSGPSPTAVKALFSIFFSVRTEGNQFSVWPKGRQWRLAW